MKQISLTLLVALSLSLSAKEKSYTTAIPDTGLTGQYKTPLFIEEEIKDPPKTKKAVSLDSPFALLQTGYSKVKYHDSTRTEHDDSLYTQTLSLHGYLPINKKWNIMAQVDHDIKSGEGLGFPKGIQSDRGGSEERAEFTYLSLFLGYTPESLRNQMWSTSLQAGYHLVKVNTISGYTQSPNNVEGLALATTFMGKVATHHLVGLSLFASPLDKLGVKTNEQYSGFKKFFKSSVTLEQYAVGLRFSHLYQVSNLAKLAWFFNLEQVREKRIISGSDDLMIRNGRMSLGLGFGF